MKIIATVSAVLISVTANTEASSHESANIIGMVQHPQSVAIGAPTTLAKLVEQCGGVNRVWSGIIMITRKTSNALSITQKHEIDPRKKLKPDELVEFLTKIMIEPGDVVYFEGYNG